MLAIDVFFVHLLGVLSVPVVVIHGFVVELMVKLQWMLLDVS